MTRQINGDHRNALLAQPIGNIAPGVLAGSDSVHEQHRRTFSGQGAGPHIATVQVDQLFCAHAHRHLLVSNLRYRNLRRIRNVCRGAVTEPSVHLGFSEPLSAVKVVAS